MSAENQENGAAANVEVVNPVLEETAEDAKHAVAEAQEKVEEDVKPETEVKDEAKDEKRTRGGNSRDDKFRGRNSKDIEREFKANRKNVKTDFESLPETDDPDEIRKQVEFYFSDSNLSFDDHMRSLVLGNTSNTYGGNESVPIKTLHSFKRMRRFQPYSAVVAALKESKTLDVEGKDGQEELRRKKPLEKPAEIEGEIKDPTIPRSIYAKGFGEEGPTTQFDIESFFAPYGPISSVRLRRTFPGREFKGSVFVEFETEESQKEFLELEPKPKFQDQELQIRSKKDYCEDKLSQIKDGKLQPNVKHFSNKGYIRKDNRNGNNDRYNNDRNGRGGRGRGGRGGGRGRGGRDRNDRRDNRDRDDWRGRRDDFQKGGRRDRDSNRDRDGDDRNGASEKCEQPVDARGVPVIQGATTGESKKRGREEDGAGGDSKKVKEEA